jgi:hypothetical protein
MSAVRRAVERTVGLILGSRYGLAALLAVVVVGVLGSARLVAGPSGAEPTTIGAAPDRPITTVDPTAGDDGLSSPESPPAPVTSPGTAKPLDVAEAFVAAWLHHDVAADEWRAALLPHSTADLTDRLADADPAGVPADRITGDLVVIPRGTDYVEIAAPLDSGRLVLRLIAPDGHWLVDGVDWERA